MPEALHTSFPRVRRRRIAVLLAAFNFFTSSSDFASDIIMPIFDLFAGA
jgi:hypothetical protein